MRSKGRKRVPQPDVRFWRVDINCEACRKRTGRPHRIGWVYRRPGMEAIGTDMFVSSPSLQILEGTDGTKVRAFCLTCQEHSGASQPALLDWDLLVYRLKLSELQGVHTAQRTV